MSEIMLRKYQSLFGCLVGFGLVQAAAAFTVWGPLETWQTADLDYGAPRAIEGGTELGGSKVLGAGSRVGVPVITYAFDYTFTEFFGAQGVQAVDQAMAILNGQPNASAASAGLTEFATDGNQQINYTAQALGLFDLKSATLTLMLERLGLQGETHVYDLSAREVIPNTTCLFDYFVINRNYDPVTYLPSTFVNGVQYGYSIVDECPIVDVADALEYPKDTAEPSLDFYTAAATFQGLQAGGYYLNLTRDDFGGLRWLYRQNHLVNEAIDPNSVATGVGSSPFGLSELTGVTNSATNVTLFGGVEKVRFVKVPFDSFVGSTFTPVTYNYNKLAVVQGRVTTVRFTRTIFQPDIVFTTADLVVRASPLGAPPVESRSVTFLPPPFASAGGGPLPNVILPQQLIIFNNALPLLVNQTPTFLSDVNMFPQQILAWGSFGSSGAAPIVYPNGASIIALENQILAGDTSSGTPSTTYNPFGVAGLTTTGAPVTFLGNY